MTKLDKYYELQKNSQKQYERFLKNLSKQTTSRDFFTAQNGLLEKGRRELHTKIINDYLRAYSAQSHPQAHFILGSIGSGKTSLKDTIVKNSKKSKILYINFDDLKLKLPEYSLLKTLNPKKAAHFVQSESAKLAGTLYKKAIKNKINIIYEKNLRLNKEGKLHLISEMKNALKKKYHIAIHVVFLDSYQEAWRRVQLRYEKIKRYVPRKYVKDTYDSLFPNLNVLMNENFNVEYTVKLWYNGKKDVKSSLKKEIQAVGLMSFQKERYVKVSCKEKDLNVVFEGINNSGNSYMGAIFNMQGLSKKARNSLKSLDCLRRPIGIFERNV